MPPTFPFWFKQRQCRAEPAGSEHAIKVSGPNLGEAYLSIRAVEGGRWQAGIRFTADGPETSVTSDLPSTRDAWDAAFELYRAHAIN